MIHSGFLCSIHVRYPSHDEEQIDPFPPNVFGVLPANSVLRERPGSPLASSRQSSKDEEGQRKKSRKPLALEEDRLKIKVKAICEAKHFLTI
jgi:hypothetical protein